MSSWDKFQNTKQHLLEAKRDDGADTLCQVHEPTEPKVPTVPKRVQLKVERLLVKPDYDHWTARQHH